MITEARGNILDADVEALVNTVNTVGVMGKGIALQFKRAFPDMFKDYASAAKRGDVEIGRMHVWPVQKLDGPRLIINFPTKRHWRGGSRLADIEAGLDDLVAVVVKEEVQSIAIPPLGCGHGGLDWSQVEPLIRAKLEPIDGLDVRLFPPEGAPAAANMRSAGPAPAMTAGRAALIKLLGSYSRLALAGATPIEIQKLMYFLQAAGEDLNLRYGRNFYGPYADNLRAVLRDVEGHYLEGFGDGSQRVQVAEPIALLAGAEEAAEAEIAAHPDTGDRIDLVMNLVAGYESAYSLELLATVHWVLREQPDAADDPERIAELVRAWSDRKQRLFTEPHVRTAWETLRDQGWLAEPAAAR